MFDSFNFVKSKLINVTTFIPQYFLVFFLFHNNTDSQNGIFFLGNGQNLENMKALSALIPKIEKILISVVKILWGGEKRFFFFGGL